LQFAPQQNVDDKEIAIGNIEHLYSFKKKKRLVQSFLLAA
jgi:hypothetical protein